MRTGRSEEHVSEGRLPLMLLPGTLCDAALFAPMLADRPVGRAIAIGDLGGSDAVDALAAAVLDDAPPRFALAGFSLGGIVALEVTVRAPDRVAGLALIASTPRPVPEQDRERRRARACAVADAGAHLAETWQLQVGRRHRSNGQLRDVLVAMADRIGTAAFVRQTEAALTRPDNRPLLAGLAMPALVLGGREDAINPPAVQAETAALLPDAVLEIVPEAGHFLPLEAPGAVATALGRWLARVDWAAPRGAATLRPCPSVSLRHRSDQEFP